MLPLGIGLAGAAVPSAHAQSTWSGVSTDYNDNNNWSPTVAPIAGGQSAIFGAGGAAFVDVNAAVAPDSWTFDATAQSYIISGSTVTFTAAGGIANNANNGSFIGVGNVLAGAGALVTQSGASTLILGGNNTYGGGTFISAGTVQVSNGASVGTGDVLLNGGTFQVNGLADLTFTNNFNVGSAGGTIDVNGTNLTLSGVVAAVGPSAVLSITDTSGSFGTAALTGVNTFAGTLAVINAKVQANSAQSIGNATLTLDNGAFQVTSNNLTFINDIKLNTGGGIIDANGNTLLLAGAISDGNAAGVLQVIDTSGGGGVVSLAGFNTYTGGTVATNVTLQVTNNASVGTGTVTLDNAAFQADGFGDITFANSFRINSSGAGSAIDANGVTLTFSGNISDGNGPGKLTLIDSTFSLNGKVILLGNNTYTGGTEICNCMTLQLGDPSHTASLSGPIANFGRLDVVNANLTGVTTLTNDGAQANFLNASSAASMTIDNINGAQLTFGVPAGADTASAGSATINNTGSMVLFLARTSSGSATINNDGGLVAFADQASGGSATIINANSGGTFFGTPLGTDTPSAGSARIVNNNLGGTQFNAFATAGNATITTNNGGVASFLDNSTAGNAAIVTNSGGQTLFFDRSTGGTAQFITVGTGYVDYSGSLGPAGDGRIPAGSIAGSGTYYLGAGKTLVVGGNNLSTTMSGVIADYNPAPPCGCPVIPGIGNLEKTGTGELILAGLNTYTGTTTVNGGTLSIAAAGKITSNVTNNAVFNNAGTVVGNLTNNAGTANNTGTINGIAAVNGGLFANNGTIIGGVTVNPGGTLGGNGFVVGNTLINGGALAPGNSIGVFNVTGNLSFTAASTYMIEVATGASDLTSVSGIATLGGAAVHANFAPGSYVTKQYTILSAAGGVAGTFDTLVNSNLPSNFKSSLSYGAKNVYLDLVLDFTPPAPPAPTPPVFNSGLNLNQTSVANALTGFFNRTGGIPITFGFLSPSGLTQASGELATGSQQAAFDAMNMFLGLLTDPFVSGRNGGPSVGGVASAYLAESGSYADAAKQKGTARDAFAKFPVKADVARNDVFDPRWSIWGSAFGGGSNSDGNGAIGSGNAHVRAYGFAAGADYRISPATLAGFALSGGGTNFSVQNQFGSGRSDLFQAGAFIRHNAGAAYLTAAAAYGWQNVTTDRTVIVPGVSFDRLRAQFNANAWSGRAEAGYRFVTPWMGITPYVAGQASLYQLPAYAEQVLFGANNFALNYAARDVSTGRSELGVRLDRSFAMQTAVLTLRGRAAWAHHFITDRSIAALFQTLPGASFLVSGAAQASDTALTTASAEVKWLNGWSAAGTFEGEFSTISRSYAGKGVLRYSW